MTVTANDTTGTPNSTTVTFTFTPPQPAPSSGGGGGSAIPPSSKNFTPTLKKYTWQEINKSVSLAVSVKGVPVTDVDLFVNQRVVDVSATIMPSRNVGGQLENVYSFFSIDFINLPNSKVDYGTIKFFVNKSWVDKYDKNKVRLYRYFQVWENLTTRLEQENDLYYLYSAVTPSFSTFAIVGEKAPVVKEPLKVCAQVITPAFKDGQCVMYSTPCDVPEGWQTVNKCPEPDVIGVPTINNMLIFLSFLAGIALIYRIVHHRKRKAIERRVHQHRKHHAKWREENKLYRGYQAGHSKDRHNERHEKEKHGKKREDGA